MMSETRPPVRRPIPRLQTVLVVLVAGLLLVAGLWLTLASRTPEPDGLGRGTIEAGGLTRTYAYHLPASVDGSRPVPLLLAFHGGGGDGAGMAEITHLNAIADAHGFLVVYPDGVEKGWADGGPPRAGRTNADDLAFVSDLIDALASLWDVDLRRVYATGISNGGLFSELLACRLSDRIAAIAPVAATMIVELAPTCDPGRPVPVEILQGTDDWLIPWEGGEVPVSPGRVVLSVNATLATWTGINGCDSEPDVRYEPDLADDGTRVRREAFGNCTSGADVVLYAVEGGGHTWPGGQQYLPEVLVGRTTRDLDAGEAMWAFFADHPMP